MKWLAAVLVVLNVGVFIWGNWYKEMPEENPRPLPALQADKMRLLSEPGVTPVPRAPVRPAPVPGTSEEAAAVGAAACFSIGPFPAAAAAARAGAQLEQLQLAYTVRAGRTQMPSAWQVLLPSFGSKAKTEAKRRELTRQGITDHYLILDGSNKGGISLGVFSTPEAAQKQLEHLRRQGVAAKIDTLYRRRAQFWLEGSVPAAPAWASVEGLRWEVPGVRASQGACPVPAVGGQAAQAAEPHLP